MRERAISALVIFAIGLPALIIGGVFYFLVISFLLVAASWEYTAMFGPMQQRSSRLVLVGGTFVISVTRAFFQDYSLLALEILVLLALAVHLVQYERGRDGAAAGFGITVAGLLYLGWIGSYLFDLRWLEHGFWWFFLALPCVWLADVGAYWIGSAYGKHKMSPRLSPHKSWEGYWAGVVSAVLVGAFLAFAYSTWGPLDVPPWHGALLGLLIGLLTPLGDLGESMFKRHVGMKDSGNIIPGHGGAFDRIDSWLWAAIIGYYYIQWFLL
jgi:phosphatidate cytidylyltransferase